MAGRRFPSLSRIKAAIESAIPQALKVLNLRQILAKAVAEQLDPTAPGISIPMDRMPDDPRSRARSAEPLTKVLELIGAGQVTLEPLLGAGDGG